MNCKQGDLAIFVKSTCGNEGKIVKCVKFLGQIVFICADGVKREYLAWECDQKISGFDGRKTSVVPDYQLRPIRDQDGEDEMLRITGIPKERVA